VPAVLGRLVRGGAISGASWRADSAIWHRARHALAGLRGTRGAELGAVVADAGRIAASGHLSASLAPSLFLTVERNTWWWTNEPLLASGARVSFPPSELVWEHYAGQGLQIQWLGTFGHGNGLIESGHTGGALVRLTGEVRALAASRAGGVAWDYLFPFDGGAPPWTSGLSQGTALELLERSARIEHSAEDERVARAALALYRTPPPAGVRIAARHGAEYAEYTFAPRDWILNGFIQADVGLYEYARLSGSPTAAQLFAQGDAEARYVTPRYNTGYWSLYDQFGESDLNYHLLLTEFLQHLCSLTRTGPPLQTPVTNSGGASSTRPVHAAIAADEIYCTTAASFRADLHTPPRLAVLGNRVIGRGLGELTVRVSKFSSLWLSVRTPRGALVWSEGATVAGGVHSLLWRLPRAPGRYSVTLAGTDLAGNHASVHTTLTLRRR
jgi:hypothetical protein